MYLDVHIKMFLKEYIENKPIKKAFFFTKNHTFAIIKLGVKYGLQYQNKRI